ncbi:MAG: radical SAM protein [Pseudonocardiales bacterium]|nr:radical SAM protein [Pseudonocardiales bacterium]
MKVFVSNQGCEQRGLDAQRVRSLYSANGHELVDRHEDAESVVVMTCAVDQAREQQSVSYLEKVVAHDQHRELVVSGCLPAISPNLVPSSARYTVGPRDLERFDRIVSGTVGINDIPDACLTSGDPTRFPKKYYSRARREYESAKAGYAVRVNHGCLLSCSYCVIRLATGLLESVPLDDILSAVNSGLAGGQQSVMLMGGDIGAYGRDCESSLPELLNAVAEIDFGQARLHMHDLNFNWVSRDLDSFTASFLALGERLGTVSLPVQSGSDSVLRAMRRPYRSDDVRAGIAQLRNANSAALLGTHIIEAYSGRRYRSC